MFRLLFLVNQNSVYNHGPFFSAVNIKKLKLYFSGCDGIVIIRLYRQPDSLTLYCVCCTSVVWKSGSVTIKKAIIFFIYNGQLLEQSLFVFLLKDLLLGISAMNEASDSLKSVRPLGLLRISASLILYCEHLISSLDTVSCSFGDSIEATWFLHIFNIFFLDLQGFGDCFVVAADFFFLVRDRTSRKT